MDVPPDLREPTDEPTGRQEVDSFSERVAVNAVKYGPLLADSRDDPLGEWTAFEVVVDGKQVFETEPENPNWDGWYYAKEHAKGVGKGYSLALEQE